MVGSLCHYIKLPPEILFQYLPIRSFCYFKLIHIQLLSSCHLNLSELLVPATDANENKNELNHTWRTIWLFVWCEVELKRIQTVELASGDVVSTRHDFRAYFANKVYISLKFCLWLFYYANLKTVVDWMQPCTPVEVNCTLSQTMYTSIECSESLA